MASVGERPKQSDIDNGKYKNYNEYRQAVLAWKAKQPDPKNPKVGDKKTIPRRRKKGGWTKAYTVIWNGKSWVKKGDPSLVPNRAYKPDLNSKEYKLAKEINERVSKNTNKKEENNNNKNNNNSNNNKNNNNNNKKVVVKEENSSNNNKNNNNNNKEDKPKEKLKIKTRKGFIRDKGRLYSVRSAEGRKVANRLKAKNRAKEMARKRKEAKQK